LIPSPQYATEGWTRTVKLDGNADGTAEARAKAKVGAEDTAVQISTVRLIGITAACKADTPAASRELLTSEDNKETHQP
jgi:hypothetical protein